MKNKHKSANESASQMFCSLSTAAFRKRKETIVNSLRTKSYQVEETKDGFMFLFNYSPELLLELAEFIRLEKECCPFFNYSIDITGADNNLSLILSGPAGTKEFIKYELEMA